jgi:flagellar hook-associated protein 1 FlgK
MYQPSNAQVGQGVNINSVYQVRDNFLDVSYRNQNSQYNMWNGMENQLGPIEDDFNEVSDSTTSDNQLTGLSGQLGDLITSLQNYAASPSSSTLSADVQSKMDILTQSIRSDASQLTTSLSDEQSELGIVVQGGSGDTENGADNGGINGMINSIQSLNVQISSYESGTGQKANDLRDQRNNLLDQLSSDIDITSTEQSNGMVTVQLQGDSSGKMLIDSGNNATTLNVGTTTSGNTVLEYSDTGNAAPVQGGLVKAYLNVINGDGSDTDNLTTGQCGNVGIPYMENKLNEFAIGLYNVMNNASDAVSSNVASSTTQLLTYTQSDGTEDTTGTAAPSTDTPPDPLNVASTIGITSTWSNNPDAFITNYSGSDNGTYVTDFANALQTTTGTVTNSDGTQYSGSLSDFADSFTQDIATEVSTVTSKAAWSKTNTDNVDQERQSISSVSTDDEGVNIIKYQQAYNANARMITVIDDMLDKLINGTGLAGISS